MGQFIESVGRNQATLLPEYLKDYVGEDIEEEIKKEHQTLCGI